MRSGLPPPLDHPARQLLFGTHQTAVRRALGREITPVVRYDDRDSFVEPRRDGPRQLAEASEPVMQLDMRQLMRGNNRIDAARRQPQRHIAERCPARPTPADPVVAILADADQNARACLQAAVESGDPVPGLFQNIDRPAADLGGCSAFDKAVFLETIEPVANRAGRGADEREGQYRPRGTEQRQRRDGGTEDQYRSAAQEASRFIPGRRAAASPEPINTGLITRALFPAERRALILHIFEPEAVAPALDVPDRGRWEVHRAAQGVGVAVALEEPPPRRHRLLAVGVDPHHQLGIARLQWRVDQVAGEHRLVAALAGADREMVGGVARGGD